jgi:uncharacterized protein (TIGR03435 family)
VPSFVFTGRLGGRASGSDADALPDLVTAFQEQLGMNLTATKALADVLVIDKVSTPSEN